MKSCEYFPSCTGCSYWDKSYLEQARIKTSELSKLLGDLKCGREIEFISLGESGLRERMDFTISTNSEMFSAGFYDQNQILLDVQNCLQLSADLQKIYAEFRSFKFPVKKGSVRLRSGKNALKGCWLDFSNLDIKALLEEQSLLRSVLKCGFVVEIGQKGKRLIDEGDRLKLVDPEPEAWFESDGLDMQCLISDFTQPSVKTAGAIQKIILGSIREIPNLKHVVEFGAGSGFFTLGFLNAGLAVQAFEFDQNACHSLLLNAKNHNLNHKLIIEKGDYHRKPVITRQNPELVFVNPARSGLKKFTDEILKMGPEYLIYVSCFPESMAEDLKKLHKQYQICNIKIIDQFPQTKHFESCVILKKSG